MPVSLLWLLNSTSNLMTLFVLVLHTCIKDSNVRPRPFRGSAIPPFAELLVDFCHSSNHFKSRTFWIINIRLKYFPNSDRRFSFLKTNSCISFLISSLSKMALCTWHSATLSRRIWPQVDRVNDFNLRRYCSLLKHETLFYTDS